MSQSTKQIYLSVTESCNLDCSWCFWKARSDEDRQRFALEPLVEAVGDALEGSGECDVVFYGGEPSLYPFRMADVMQALRSSHAEVEWRFAVQTNGTKLENLLPLLEDLWYLSVSVNAHTLQSMSWPELAEIAERLPVIARMIYIGEPLEEMLLEMMPHVSHVYWQLLNDAELPFTRERYHQQLLALVALAHEYPDHSFVPLDYAASCLGGKLSESSLRGFPCGVGTDLVYLDPSGGRHACDELSLPDQELNFEELRRLCEEFCSGCEWQESCRGRCPAVAAKYGWSAYENYCAATEVLFRTVRETGYRGRPVDEIALQTEVLH